MAARLLGRRRKQTAFQALIFKFQVARNSSGQTAKWLCIIAQATHQGIFLLAFQVSSHCLQATHCFLLAVVGCWKVHLNRCIIRLISSKTYQPVPMFIVATNIRKQMCDLHSPLNLKTKPCRTVSTLSLQCARVAK